MGIEDFGKFEIYDADDEYGKSSASDEEQYQFLSTPDEEEDLPDDGRPSDIILHATSTENPQRPRTLAAGYDPKTRTMTVVFRKNVWWNYYDVPFEIWEEFQAAPSKGKYLQEGLDNWKRMGRPNMGSFSKRQRAKLNNLAKEAETYQLKTGGLSQKYGRVAAVKNAYWRFKYGK